MYLVYVFLYCIFMEYIINNMSFTLTQQEIIIGSLLGDGCLEMGRNNKNACFIYASSCKEHVEFVHNYLKEYCTNNYKKVKRSEIFDKRTEKTYIKYYFRTKCLTEFTEYYDVWYTPKKAVPNFLNLPPLTVLTWYLGDGELESKHGYIKLHTNSFSKEDCLKLCSILGFESKLLKKAVNQWLVSIPRKQVSSFLNYIGECPVNCYFHKWSQIPYKNKNIEKNGVNNYSEKYPDIIKDWESGKFSVYSLSKKYNIPCKCIYNHFEKNGVERKNIDNRKKIQQLDLSNNLIKSWNSGQEIKRELGFNSSAISECCRGIRKKYKQFKWKFSEI